MLLIILGESASGKSSLKAELVRKYGFKDVVTYTTRPPRSGEVDHVDYHFISEDEFKRMIENNEMVEWTTYNDWYYGTALKDCSGSRVLVANPHGLREFKKHSEIDITSFYLKVNRRDLLINILKRGDNIDEAYRRNLHDNGQFSGLEDEVDYVIYNDGYEKSVEELADIVISKINGSF